jgi:hypothetical protein
VSGKALAAGIAANQTDQKPAARALPLTCLSNGANPMFQKNGLVLKQIHVVRR